ncbi:MAG: ribonucleotide reductase [Alphaproteobacteria bacterium]|nr:ribonucleotide reductase [Alphaproteobacteria bacterium]
MSRTRLPNRRPSETTTVVHDGRDYAVTIGGDPATGIIREVFAGDSHTGSAMDAILNDACVALSLLLQHGVEPATLAHSMGRIDNGREPASIIGALVDHIALQEARP